MYGLIGKKVKMTQIFNENGHVVPVTLVEAGPCKVLQVKTDDKDGYNAVQIGFNPKGKAPNKVNSCKTGHAKKASSEPQQISQEFRLPADHNFEIGNTITVEDFKSVDKVDVVSKTKGKGFQGVVKRWNFSGGPASHGSMFHRRGGSYGLCQWPGRIFKNKKMPGHMGAERVTIQNLELVKVDADRNLLFVKGGVPGHRGAVLEVRKAVK